MSVKTRRFWAARARNLVSDRLARRGTIYDYLAGRLKQMDCVGGRVFPAAALAAAALFFLLTATAVSAATEYGRAAEPPWVRPLTATVPVSLDKNKLSGGIAYLLSDNQTLVLEDTVLHYYHLAQQAVNQSGMESMSRVALKFDPHYEKITLHRLNLIRDGKSMDMTARARIVVLQREKDAEAKIYDGSKTINIDFEDVRVGDVLDYSYTLQGANPVLGKRYYDGFSFGWSVPVMRAEYRLLWPSGRTLHIKSHGSVPAPRMRALSGATEYVWSVNASTPISEDEDLPAWYDPYPWVQLSESGNWREVVQWALPLYTVRRDIGTDVRSVAAGIAARSQDKREMLVEALHFVQNEIRYLGIEMGARSYAPNPPDMVLRQRFGDCKDKSLLMVTLLRELGIEAYPALVNTRYRKQIAEWQPTPTAFNHLIVYAHMEGKAYWLDPTRLYQKGTLDTLHQPDYGRALVIDTATSNLTEMIQIHTYHEKSVDEVYDLRGATGESTAFSVETHYRRYYADGMRESLATQNHDEIKKSYVKYYERQFPDIRATRDFVVTDDALANQVTVAEAYAIPRLWKPDKDGGNVRFAFYPSLITGYLGKTPSVTRAMPLSVPYPVRLRHQTRIPLPESFQITESSDSVSDPVFSFTRKVYYKDKEVLLDYRYETKRDYVAADEMGRYMANLAKVNDLLGYELYKPAGPVHSAASATGSINWTVSLVALFGLVIWAGAAGAVYRYDPLSWSDRHNQAADARLAGISGWLVLPAIGLLIQPFILVGGLLGDASSYSSDVWQNLMGNASISQYFIPLLLVELILRLGMLVFSALLLILFFLRRTSVPRVYVGLALLAGFYTAIEMLAAASIPEVKAQVSAKDYAAWLRDLVGIVLWSSYFLTSKRVRATFIRRRHGRAAAPVAVASAGARA